MIKFIQDLLLKARISVKLVRPEIKSIYIGPSTIPIF